MTPPRRRLLPFCAGAALLTAAANAAIEQPPIITPPLSDAEFRELIGPAMAAAQAEDCAALGRLVEPALPRLSGRNRNAVQLLRIPCLAASGRAGEAADTYRELAASDPKSGLIRSIGVVVAVSSGDFAEAGNRLASLADEDPDALGRLTGRVARGITQALTEERAFPIRDRVFIALARADWQPRDDPDMRGSLAQGAIEALLSTGRGDEAESLLPRIDAPEILAAMATVRHCERLWPAIEARLGATAATAIDRYAAARIDGFANHPDDDEARRDAARAFLLLGRFAEVGEIAAPVRVASTMSEADVATVRYDAQALAATGKTAEAAARLRPFTAIDLAQSPAAASGLVSLAELLDESGREDEALVVARAALGANRASFSPWGAGWLKRTQACALAALGRKAEAVAIGDALKREARNNVAASIEALLCLHRDDEAAALATTTLASAEGAGLLADQFQPEGALWAPGPSRLRGLWIAFRQRRDVKAAFDKAARILPERYWPARTPRPIPRTPRPDDLPVA
jgi:hypothetical protein